MPKPREVIGDYDVGYGKPPVAGRFKPGQSGNPRGRKKGALDTKTYYEQAASAKVTVKVGDRKITMTKIEAAIHHTINKAAAGDLRALVHTIEEMKRLGIGLGAPDGGTGQVPVSELYTSIIERALADRSPESAEPKPSSGDERAGGGGDEA